MKKMRWIAVALLVALPTIGYAGSPAPWSPRCENCAVCDNNCQCAGGGVFCSNGACPVQTVQYRTATVCENGTCRLVQVPITSSVSKSGVAVGNVTASCSSCSSVTASAGHRNGLFARIADYRANRKGLRQCR